MIETILVGPRISEIADICKKKGISIKLWAVVLTRAFQSTRDPFLRLSKGISMLGMHAALGHSVSEESRKMETIKNFYKNSKSKDDWFLLLSRLNFGEAVKLIFEADAIVPFYQLDNDHAIMDELRATQNISTKWNSKVRRLFPELELEIKGANDDSNF